MVHRAVSSSPCRLEDVLVTHELKRRPARKNFAVENRALATLARALAEAPEKLQATLVELVLELCHGDSAGISLLEAGPPAVFRWTAVAGRVAGHLGETVPLRGSPCGIVIERNELVLFRDGARYFPPLRGARPAVHECLLAPFAVDGKPGGTVWAVKHRRDGRFNAEDARLLRSVSGFAGAASRSAQARRRADYARDTTSALYSRLLQVSKLAMIGEIASGVANELSQPLTAIEHYAQACGRRLRREHGELASLSAAMEEISAQAQRASETIEGLRRLVAARPIEASECDLNETVEETLEMIRVDARTRAVRIELRLADRLPRIRIERTQIQHVVLNLLRNSLDALESNPRDRREVVLETQGHRESVELIVSDNGPGLPEDVRARMFSPLYSTKAAGTGLGLPISHSIVRAHGGGLDWQQSVTGGACFRIRFPLSPGTSLARS